MNYTITTIFILDILVILASTSLFFQVNANLYLLDVFLKDFKQMNHFSIDRSCIFAYFWIQTNVMLAIWWDSFQLYLYLCILIFLNNLIDILNWLIIFIEFFNYILCVRICQLILTIIFVKEDLKTFFFKDRAK